jgi:hypothetical protein
MRSRDVKSLLWWLPALIAAAVAGIMPDTFLDSPYTTIPHEAAYVLRFWIIVSAFAYIAILVAIRGVIHIGERFISSRRRGFPVVTTSVAASKESRT